jgi:vitamin B12 transporter
LRVTAQVRLAAKASYEWGPAVARREVPAQTTHNVGLSYFVETEIARVNATFEVQNVTDEQRYDFFGAQRPGRTFYAKLGGQI